MSSTAWLATNPGDERLFALAEVRDLTPVVDDAGRVVALPELERMLVGVFETIREFQTRRAQGARLYWNRVLLYAWPTIELSPEEIKSLVIRLAPTATGLGIEEVLVRGRLREADDAVRDCVLRFYAPGGQGRSSKSTTRRPARSSRSMRVPVGSSRHAGEGPCYPAEIVQLLAPVRGTKRLPAGEFVEHELDAARSASSQSTAHPRPTPTGIVVGTVRNFTERYPEGMTRVDPARRPDQGAGLARRARVPADHRRARPRRALGVPVEWFALSAGAKIAMDSGTENMDWIAAVLRRIIEFTQAGGEINVVVTGINVGAQPYWNAEATMLMHTRGILVMTPDSAMVLTGKQALDYSGGVSAEDNFGIGGYDRIMGPNGQAQYWAADLGGRLPGAAGPLRARLRGARRALPAPRADRRPGRPRRRRRRRTTLRTRTSARSATSSPTTTNPERKKPFDIRIGDARRGRPRPSAAGALGRDARRRDRGGLGRAPRRLPGRC